MYGRFAARLAYLLRPAVCRLKPHRAWSVECWQTTKRTEHVLRSLWLLSYTKNFLSFFGCTSSCFLDLQSQWNRFLRAGVLFGHKTHVPLHARDADIPKWTANIFVQTHHSRNLSKFRYNAAFLIRNLKFSPNAHTGSFPYCNFQPSNSHHFTFCYSTAANIFCACH